MAGSRFFGRARRRRKGLGAGRRGAAGSLATSVLEVDGDVAVVTIDRTTLSLNRSIRSHWTKNNRERDAWETMVKYAIVSWLEARARTRAARLAIAPALVQGKLPRAPRGRYRVEIVRQIVREGNKILDEDNLRGGGKPLLDALVSNGLIFADSMEFLDCPLPVQRVGDKARTVIRIAPFWHLTQEVL